MPKTVLVDVRYLKNSAHACKETEALFRHAGLKNVQCKDIAALYKLTGSLVESDVKKISQEILSDPVAQKFIVNARPKNSKTFFIDVWYKPGVTDTVGDSLLKAARDLGCHSLVSAPTGARFEIQCSKKSDSLEKQIIVAAGKLLLNPLVQECQLIK